VLRIGEDRIIVFVLNMHVYMLILESECCVQLSLVSTFDFDFGRFRRHVFHHYTCHVVRVRVEVVGVGAICA